MKFEYSNHWVKKKNYRPEITDEIIWYCIKNSNKIKDKTWPDVLNAIVKLPSSGRILKVVYKMKGETIKILTAYWLR